MANGSDDFKLGERLGGMESDIKGIHSKIDALNSTMSNFTAGLGVRVEFHDTKITTLNTEMEFFKKIALLIFTPIVGAISLSILYLILKH